MELNRFKQLLESTMGNVKPLITEQNTNSYTLKNDKSLENAMTVGILPELKLFKGATFTKSPGAKELVANTKYQFVDSATGQVLKGPNDLVASYVDNTLAAVTYGVSSAIGSVGGTKTYSGEVTYYCGLGKFKVKESKDEYFDEEKNLSNMLKGVCSAKDAPVTDPIVTPKSNHVCDTDPTSKLHPGLSFRYCKNGENYYFKGVSGEFKDKNPNWTLSTGQGLESIKKMIGPVFDNM